MINEFSGLILSAQVPGSTDTYPVNGGDLLACCSTCHVTPNSTGAYFLAYLGLNPLNFFFDFYVLVALGVVLFVAAFVMLTSIKETR
jgi:hypothetical protein